MFKELAPYLRQCAILLIVTHLEEDQIRVNVIPQKIKDGENTALTHATERDWNSRRTRPGSAVHPGEFRRRAPRAQEHAGSCERGNGRGSQGSAGGSPLKEQVTETQAYTES